MKKAYKYGIELETLVDYDALDLIREEVSAKSLPYEDTDDGSISGEGEGAEWKCSRPLTYTELERSVKSFCKILNSHDVQVNTSTGFHLHVSNKRFTNPQKLKRIVFLWCAIEDVLMATQPRSRYGNTYCKRLLQSFILGKDSKLPTKKKLLIDELRYRNEDGDRYYTLNLSALMRHNTIECRLHSGTIDSEKILAWVDLIIAIYDYALSNYNQAEVMALFKTQISDEKIDKVFSMLKLEKDTTQHFKKRIKKFGFELLQLQQQGAIKALEIKPKVDKLAKKYSDAQIAYDMASREIREATNVFGRHL